MADSAVLVISDSPNIHTRVEALLQSDGVRGLAAAGDVLRTRPVQTLEADLILVDPGLSTLHDLPSLRKWLADPILRDVPVLWIGGAQTDSANEPVRAEPQAHGAEASLTDRREAETRLREQASALNVTNLELKSQWQRLRAINEKLIEAKREAEAANHAKSTFLANMSHEIRTPMTAILGFVEQLLEDMTREGAPPQHIDAISTVRRNGEYLMELINDILDISKVEAGAVDVERIPCSPGALMSDVISLMKPRASAKGLTLRVEYATPIPETIHSDPTRIRQILINLVGNAVKFTRWGSVRVVASLQDFIANGEPGPTIRFDVIDTGVGMTDEQMSRLFQPFTQADAATTREYGGTGLGLAISQRFARLLGGDLTAESIDGEGSTFRTAIPTGPIDGVRRIDQPPTKDEVAGEHPDTQTPASSPAPLVGRILLAEDSPDNSRLISLILERAGARIVCVSNGRDAVDHVRGTVHRRREGDPREPIDLILMDVQMPVMDGREATQILRREGFTGPIIALTAYATAADRQRCLGAGCDAFVPKPINRRQLLDAIRAHLPATAGLACTPAGPA